MYKIAAMGDRDSIYGFASLGLSVFPEDDPQSASHKLKKLAEDGYAVIFITEALAEASFLRKSSASKTALSRP